MYQYQTLRHLSQIHTRDGVNQTFVPGARYPCCATEYSGGMYYIGRGYNLAWGRIYRGIHSGLLHWTLYTAVCFKQSLKAFLFW